MKPMSDAMSKKTHHRLVLLLLLGLSTMTTGCSVPSLAKTPNLYAESADNPFRDVPAALQSSTIEILYATDRKPVESDDSHLSYGFERSVSLAYGRCEIEVGEALSWPDLVEASRAANRTRSLPLTLKTVEQYDAFPETRAWLIEQDGRWIEDPAYRTEIEVVTKGLHGQLSARLALTPRKEVFLFVHGYNNTFEDAAFRMATLWHYLGRIGVPIMYSWPAGHGGLLRGYNYDRESGEFTILHLRQFIEAIASCPEVEKIHIIAHSRGTDVATTALRELNLLFQGAGRDTREVLKLGNVILAAPDLDLEVAVQRIAAERLLVVPERFTIYMSQDDKAIGISAWLFASLQRLGQMLEGDLNKFQLKQLKKLPQINLIRVKANLDFLGHGYFISNPAVLSDLILILRDDRDPGAENGRPLHLSEGGFWELGDDYPSVID